MTKHIIHAALASVIAIASLASAAQAQDARIAYHSHEMATSAGRQIVLSRIERAAREACEGGRTLKEVTERKACAASLTHQMVAQAGVPALTALVDGTGMALAAR